MTPELFHTLPNVLEIYFVDALRTAWLATWRQSENLRIFYRQAFVDAIENRNLTESAWPVGYLSDAGYSETDLLPKLVYLRARARLD